MDDTFFMEMTLDLAAKGQGLTTPNPMVGAVVVKEGRVVGSGYHQGPGLAHAEVNAIDDAEMDAGDATLYVNLEPCNHTGRTPPCTHKILQAGIRRVVVAMEDPNPDVQGGGIDFLKQHGVDVTLGVCAERAKKLNEAFIKYVLTKRPFVILKCAATLDGRIATRTGDSKWVTGEQAREYVHRLRHAVDAVMVGIGTIQADNPRLTTRPAGGRGKDPIRIILDTHLAVSAQARVLQLDSNSDTILVACKSAAGDKKPTLEKKGVRVIEAAVKDGLIDMVGLIDQLGQMGITSLLIEGGSRVAGSALRAGIVDKILFFYAPKILGGDDGMPICRGQGPDLMDGCIPVKDISLRSFGDDVLIEGYIAKI
jgi:diaminohydroxyphosphoribosylaminopyrimidine deaminase/5-amino-6-(5-phosphoribosylamino)uracil reductase